jgi:hypothetical protein
MTDARFREIESLIEEAGRCFDPFTGQFEPLDGDDEDTDRDLEPQAFLAVLGITADECAEYVQLKMQEYQDRVSDA